jgi:hypothetical protein
MMLLCIKQLEYGVHIISLFFYLYIQKTMYNNSTTQARHNGYKHLYTLLSFSQQNCIHNCHFLHVTQIATFEETSLCFKTSTTI